MAEVLVLDAGDDVRVWLPDASDAGGSFWLGSVTDDVFPDGAVGVALAHTGGVVAKVPPRQVFSR